MLLVLIETFLIFPFDILVNHTNGGVIPKAYIAIGAGSLCVIPSNDFKCFLEQRVPVVLNNSCW